MCDTAATVQDNDDFTAKGGVECSANEQKFFVYSVDPSMVYPFVASFNASLAPPEVLRLFGPE